MSVIKVCLKLSKTNTKPKYCVPNVNRCMNVFVKGKVLMQNPTVHQVSFKNQRKFNEKKKIKILKKSLAYSTFMLASIIYFVYLYDLNIAGFFDKFTQSILS